MKIDVNENLASEIFRNTLREDYDYTVDQVAELLNKETLQNFEFRDLCYNVNLLDAMEVLINYYFTVDEAKDILINWSEGY